MHSDHQPAYQPTNLIIGGLTGSGKNLISMKLVDFFRKNLKIEAEIINADSVQIYKDLKIIANHPSSDDYTFVQHHLYEILEPFEKTSVASWAEKAKSIIENLNSENKIAIICGGTGFYLDAIQNDITEIPSVPFSIRENVQKKFNIIGREKFCEELSQLDPNLMKTLHKNNTQRLLRAYEVAIFTGKPLSEWWNTEKISQNIQKNYKIFILLPDRKLLREIVIERTKKMINSGAIEEVLEFFGHFPNYSGPLKKVIGYDEILKFSEKKISLNKCIDLIVTKTMQYAKRQSTWFRNKMPHANFLYGFGNDEKIFEEIIKKYNFQK